MIFARPPKGFKLAIPDRERVKLDQWFCDYPNFQTNWEAFCERVVISGHREGARISQLEESNSYVVRVDATAPPDFQAVYTILGDTLTIRAIRLINIPR